MSSSLHHHQSGLLLHEPTRYYLHPPLSLSDVLEAVGGFGDDLHCQVCQHCCCVKVAPGHVRYVNSAKNWVLWLLNYSPRLPLLVVLKVG